MDNRTPIEYAEGGPINKLDGNVDIFDKTDNPGNVIKCFDYAYANDPRLSTYDKNVDYIYNGEKFAESDRDSLKNLYMCGKNNRDPKSDTTDTGLVRHNGLHMHYIGDFTTLDYDIEWSYDESSKLFSCYDSYDMYTYDPST